MPSFCHSINKMFDNSIKKSSDIFQFSVDIFIYSMIRKMWKNTLMAFVTSKQKRKLKSIDSMKRGKPSLFLSHKIKCLTISVVCYLETEKSIFTKFARSKNLPILIQKEGYIKFLPFFLFL